MMRRIALALVVVMSFGALAQTVPVPTKNGQPGGLPAVAGDPLFLQQLMSFFGLKLDINGDVSGLHVTVPGGLINRLLSAVLGDVADVHSYAACTGAAGTDDTSGVAAWLSSGKMLRFSQAQCRLSSLINLTVPSGSALSVVGTARQLSQFLLTTPTAGIAINAAAPDFYSTPQVVLRDFTIVPMSQGTGAGLSVAFATTTGNGWTDPMADIANINVRPSAAGNYVTKCFTFTNVSLSSIGKLNCEGNRGGYVPGSIAFDFVGYTNIPVETNFRDLHAFWMDTGLQVQGVWQGISLSASTMIAVRVGVAAIGPSTPDSNEYWLRVYDCTLDATDYDVQTINVGQVHVYHNLLYLRSWGYTLTSSSTSDAIHPAAAVYDHMTTTETAYLNMSDNEVQDVYPTADTRAYHYGLDLDGVAGGQTIGSARDNTLFGLGYGFFLGPHSSGFHVGHEHYDGILTAQVANYGTNNTMAPAVVTLTSGNQAGN